MKIDQNIRIALMVLNGVIVFGLTFVYPLNYGLLVFVGLIIHLIIGWPYANILLNKFLTS